MIEAVCVLTRYFDIVHLPICVTVVYASGEQLSRRAIEAQSFGILLFCRKPGAVYIIDSAAVVASQDVRRNIAFIALPKGGHESVRRLVISAFEPLEQVRGIP